MRDRQTPPDQDDSRRSTTGSLGAGSEATAGVHADQGDGTDGTDGASAAPAGTDAVTGRGAEGTADRAGSEPLERDREHKPSYGGEGGKPRTSSDQREPINPS